MSCGLRFIILSCALKVLRQRIYTSHPLPSAEILYQRKSNIKPLTNQNVGNGTHTCWRGNLFLFLFLKHRDITQVACDVTVITSPPNMVCDGSHNKIRIPPIENWKLVIENLVLKFEKIEDWKLKIWKSIIE